MRTIEQAKNLIGFKVQVTVPSFYCRILEEIQEARSRIGILEFVGSNDLLGGFDQVIVSGLPMRVRSWDNIRVLK